MMLDVDFAQLREGFLNYLPFGMVIGLIVLVELIMAVGLWAVSPVVEAAARPETPQALSNTEALGRVLYTDYLYFFQLAGLVLLVAMIGAIVLTLHHKAGVRRQDIGAQVARTKAKGLKIVDVKPGQGV
jgi:NADH-quinone oxidoreductase subunit J